MQDHPGWYPPGQVCYPPELPEYLKNVYDLKPIVGVPSDDEVIGIHSVIHTANRVLGVPGMHNPDMFMKLADHLFSVQMARYRSKYSLITFPSDATYTPPVLPSHISVHLESVSGTPSDAEITKVQDAVQTYQEFRRIPSMFDPHVNMELSQHLFNIQMARYMRLAGESQPTPVSPAIARSEELPTRITEQTPNAANDSTTATNNAGTGSNAVTGDQTPPLAPGTGMQEFMERSNQLSEHFNRVLERLTQLVELSHRPADQSHQLAERFNQLLDRFNQLVEQSNSSTQRTNELAERSNEIAEGANELAKQTQKPLERLGDMLRNINNVLVGVQHAIVRNHKGNTMGAVNCLVNEKGETPGCGTTLETTFSSASNSFSSYPGYRLPIAVDGAMKDSYMHSMWLGIFLKFYGIDDGLCYHGTNTLISEKENEAKNRLGNYLSACLG